MKKLIISLIAAIAVTASANAISVGSAISVNGFNVGGLDVQGGPITFTPGFAGAGVLDLATFDGNSVTIADINFDVNGVFDPTPIDPFLSFSGGLEFVAESGNFNIATGSNVVTSLDDALFKGFFRLNGDFEAAGELTFTQASTSTSYTISLETVPDESSTVALLGLGLAGLGAIARRRK